MTSIIEAIDSYTSTLYPSYNKKLFGFCELMKKTAGEGRAEQVMPVTIPARAQVSIIDSYQLITWVRWINPATYDESSEWSYGKNEARVGTLPLRLIFAYKASLGENLVFDFINSFPSKFEISGFRYVHVVASPTIDPDHETIYTTELSNTVYEKHRFTWNIYAVNITVQFLQCEN